MQKLKLVDYTKKKLDDMYLVMYTIKNDINIKKGDCIENIDIYTNSLIFKIPNNVINEVYNEYFLSLLKDINIEIDTTKENEFISEICKYGKIDKLTDYVSEILRLSDNKIFMKFDEKYVQSIYFTLLCKNRIFSTYNEYQCKNGYIDLMLFRNNNLCKYNIMIELKYIKQKDYNKGLLNRLKEEGRKQLVSYSKDDRIDNNTKKYLVIFVGSKLKVMEEVL